MERKKRVLIAKPGLDGHTRGVLIVVQALRDAGMEVIYTGLHQTPEQIVSAAIQENVDAVGLGSMSGAHMTLFPKILNLLRESGADNIIVFVGGVIPKEDAQLLRSKGIAEIFGPGTPTQQIVEWIKSL